MKTLILWIAQGFGLGRIPFTPGSFGSLIGLAWFTLLLAPRDPWMFLAGTAISSALAIWICGAAEKILNQTDPGSIVLDEIVAMPLCFLGWLAILFFDQGSWPAPQYFFSAGVWPWTIGVFVLFRIFDIVKPWPLGLSQTAPGGLGVVLDDLLAAVYVNAVVLLIWATRAVSS